MKVIAWLAGIAALVTAAVYMIVSLNRWEWNRALFFGLIVLIAEVGLATALVLRRLNRLGQGRAVDPAIAEILRETRPERDRFAWMREPPKNLNVFITFLVGGGVVLSAGAWVVDRIAARTSSPVAEQRLARGLEQIAYPDGGVLLDDITVLAQEVPGADDAQIRKLLRDAGTRLVTSLRHVALGAAGLAIGAVGVFALREATLSTHEPVEGEATELVVAARSKGAEPDQTLDEMVEAQILACRLEVTSDLAAPIESIGTGRYRAVLTPAMDFTNRRQFRGCLEDWVIDHVNIDVVSLEVQP